MDPNVSVFVENGFVFLKPDSMVTPGDDSIAIDMSGEWDAGDAGIISGVLDIVVAAFKIFTSYDGLVQSILNPALTPDCTPEPGSADWVELFGPYGVLNADGGQQRMVEAGAALSEAFGLLGFGFGFISLEVDDQNDDIVAYLDCGFDGLCPGMAVMALLTRAN